MITALQASKLETALALSKAREELLSVRSQICWNEKTQTALLDETVSSIDMLFAQIIPNNREGG